MKFIVPQHNQCWGFGCPFHGCDENWREFSAGRLVPVLMPAGQCSWKHLVRLFGVTDEPGDKVLTWVVSIFSINMRFPLTPGGLQEVQGVHHECNFSKNDP